jgi:hypothetical protein
MRTTAKYLAAGLLVAASLAGCGGSDRDGDAARSPVTDTALPAPKAVVSRAAPPAMDSSQVRVTIGGEDDLDACGSVAEITGPVALRRGPGEQFAVVGQLDRGTQVYACDISPERRWDGVVVLPAEEAEDCGVSSPIPNRRAYAGPCRSGWVRSDSLVVVAG